MLFFKDIFLPGRFFWGLGVCAFLFAISFVIPTIFFPAIAVLGIFTFLVISDLIFLKTKNSKLLCKRDLPTVLPLGDPFDIHVMIQNLSSFNLAATVVDELPEQFQEREFSVRLILKKGERKLLNYPVRAVTRGVYTFGNCNIFIQSPIGFIQKRFIFTIEEDVAAYPSILQMKQHELNLQKQVFQFIGIKKMRRIGHSYEFEQIKNYVTGDDVRCINWKATSRRNVLMVNQYGDEKSQQVYSILDKSRVMQMPFYGMSLLDYAINTSLVISNTALIKYDKAGYISFAEKIGIIIKADSKPTQLKTILEALYKEEESTLEANYEMLYQAVKHFINQRSLLILYTNFESYYSLERMLPILRKLNQQHLLLVVFFKNTEIEKYSYGNAEDMEEVYNKTIGKKFLFEKEMIVKELSKYGIQALLTAPEDLSTNTINKYLEFKAKGWI